MPHPATQHRRLFSTFERWPDAVFYAPVIVYWFWLGLRYRGMGIVSAANPGLKYGGIVGESKAEGLELLGRVGRVHLAPFTTVKTAGVSASDLVSARNALTAAHISFPIVAKPDVGRNGTGVKIVRDETDLEQYLSKFPVNTDVVLQTYIMQEGEAGVFYVREPGDAHGKIVSLTLKYFPRVTGDGTSTLQELILNDARASLIAPLYLKRFEGRLDEVVANGESIKLVSVGNHCKGAIFKNGAAHITPEMEAAFDVIAREIPGFYFGRFDVRFEKLDDLRAGKHFFILEVNGTGSEMTHIWDADETLLGAYRTMFYQYRTAYRIGAKNIALGATPTRFWELVRVFRAEVALLAAYPITE